jgi:hypothetical protein
MPSVKSSWLLFLLAVVLFISIDVNADSHKQIVGATEFVFIEEAHRSVKARVDTGAKTSSVHASNIELDRSGNPQGKPIAFYLVADEGPPIKIETRVASVVKVRTSEGAERRYVVPLQITWNDSKKTVLVTLNDRRAMKYRLLLGRNWLHGDFIVDVDKNNED